MSYSSSLINFIRKIFLENENNEISKENIELFSERILQLWSRTTNSFEQAFRILDYLEDFLKTKSMHDTYFILILSTLAKNEDFYEKFLLDHKRFDLLFNCLTKKNIYLIRYFELIYYYCPERLIKTVGLEFYRYIMIDYCQKYLEKFSNDIDWIAEFSELIFQFHENMKTTSEKIFSHSKNTIDYSIYVINTLIHHQFQTKDFHSDLKLINTISKTLAIVWEENDKSIEISSLEYFFHSISSPNETISAALLPIFSLIQLDLADLTLRTMYSDHRLTAEGFVHMIKSLIFLINSPNQLIQTISYETWITGLCSALVNFHQHEYLKKLIDETLPYLIKHFQTSENSFPILFWFIRYDKRSETFRFVLDHLMKIFENNSNENFKTKFIELYHLGLAIHPDFDLSNDKLLQNLPQADLNILSNHRLVHARLHSNIAEFDSKKLSNRLGIINLGNTCYVNSVLQALYQCDLFRKYILEEDFSNEIVLKELQRLFAQLNLSKRSYINAMNFIHIARPSWFTMNEQQDCAEFLGYLLDTIKDEETNRSKEIERLFTIHTCQINRCLTCQIESYRNETNNYLFLPIPTSTNEQIKTSLNLQDVFNSYFQKEELKDDNQYECEHCQSLQDAERYIILQTAPEYLILSLNRFEYEKSTNLFRKIFTKITYPKILHVSTSLIKYCLVLVIVHTGYTLHSGHYYVYAREIKPLILNVNETIEDYFSNDEWFLLNDDFVQSSSYELMIENCAQYTSATPYILIYKRVDEQRIQDLDKMKTIHVKESLIKQIQEDNLIYEREQEKD